MSDPINPAHYKSHPSGVECIVVTRHMSFNIGNVIKYLWRAGLKDQTPTLQDLKKAAWYLNDEVERLKSPEEKRADVDAHFANRLMFANFTEFEIQLPVACDYHHLMLFAETLRDYAQARNTEQLDVRDFGAVPDTGTHQIIEELKKS